jgi:hypothetical protein
MAASHLPAVAGYVGDAADAAAAIARGAIAGAAGVVGMSLQEHHVEATLWTGVAVVALLTFGHALAGVPLRLIGQSSPGGVRTRLFGCVVGRACERQGRFRVAVSSFERAPFCLSVLLCRAAFFLGFVPSLLRLAPHIISPKHDPKQPTDDNKTPPPRNHSYDNSRGEFPHFAAFAVVVGIGLAAFHLLRPWPLLFFGIAAAVVLRNATARMTSKPPPPRRGQQVLNKTPQFPPQRKRFEELHQCVVVRFWGSVAIAFCRHAGGSSCWR